MTSYFVDTWYFVALANPFDQSFSAAERLRRGLRSRPLVTHDGVFIEVLNFFSAHGTSSRQRAALMVRRAAMECEVVLPVDRALFRSALSLYEARPDKEYSLVDCMSMVVMRARGITHVLTNDHHFRQEGFTVLSDAP